MTEQYPAQSMQAAKLETKEGHRPDYHKHLRSHDTVIELVCRLLLEKK